MSSGPSRRNNGSFNATLSFKDGVFKMSVCATGKWVVRFLRGVGAQFPKGMPPWILTWMLIVFGVQFLPNT